MASSRYRERLVKRKVNPPIRGGQHARKERGKGSVTAAISRESSAVGTSFRAKQLRKQPKIELKTLTG